MTDFNYAADTDIPTDWEMAVGGWTPAFVAVFVIGIILSFVSQQTPKWNTRNWDWTFWGSAVATGVATFCYFTRLFGFAMSMWGAVPLSLAIAILLGVVTLMWADAS